MRLFGQRVEDSMPEITKDQVKKALADAQIPSGAIANVAACDGMVTVDLRLASENGPAREAMRNKVADIVRSLDGVDPEQVRVNVGAGGSPAPAEDSGVPGVRHVISIGSGKGGVGKSSGVSFAFQGVHAGLSRAGGYRGVQIGVQLGLDGDQGSIDGVGLGLHQAADSGVEGA